MQTLVDRYRSRVTTGWTRIDMLLALYQRLLCLLDEDALSQGPAAMRQAQVQRLVLALVAGLDASTAEPVASIRRLLSFVLQRVQSNSPDDWRAARQVLAILHAGYEQIAPECRLLERKGVTPRLDVGL